VFIDRRDRGHGIYCRGIRGRRNSEVYDTYFRVGAVDRDARPTNWFAGLWLPFDRLAFLRRRFVDPVRRTNKRFFGFARRLRIDRQRSPLVDRIEKRAYVSRLIFDGRIVARRTNDRYFKRLHK